MSGLCQADDTPTAQEPLQNFKEPCRVSEEHPNTARNYQEAPENSDDLLSTGEFPHETYTCNDSDDSESLTENPMQDFEGASSTSYMSPSADMSSHGRQCKMLKTMAELVLQRNFNDIVYKVHQVAKYSSDPRNKHGEAIIYINKYLKAMRHVGLCFKPDPIKGFQCYCDTDFAGNWNKQFLATDPMPPSLEVDGSDSMLVAPSFGHPNFSLKLHCQPQKLMTFPCPCPYEMSSH